jgi:hypothetical protein
MQHKINIDLQLSLTNNKRIHQPIYLICIQNKVDNKTANRVRNLSSKI